MRNLILLVDDEPGVINALQRALDDEPVEVRTAHSGEEGLTAMQSQNFKVVVSDERMPGMGGAEFLSIVRQRHPATVRIMLTGHASLETTMKAVNAGEIYRFFSKPWDDLVLRLAIRSAIEKYDLEAENLRLLKTVRCQAIEIRVLEKRYPGISRVEKDAAGNLVMPDIPDEEMTQILEECLRECY